MEMMHSQRPIVIIITALIMAIIRIGIVPIFDKGLSGFTVFTVVLLSFRAGFFRLLARLLGLSTY